MEEISSFKLNQMYQKTMFSVLLIEVAKEMRIPISILNSAKFMSFIKFLNPSVTVPTISECLEISMANSEFFQKREKAGDTPQEKVEQLKMVSKWIEFKIDQEKKRDETETFTHFLTKICNRTENNVQETRKYKTLPVLTMEKALAEGRSRFKPPKNTISFNALENLEVVENCEEVKPVVNGQEIPEEQMNQLTISAEIKPLPQNSEMNLSDRETTSSDVSSPILDEQCYDEDGHFVPLPNHEYTKKYKSSYKKSSSLVTFKDVPGYVKYPCIVCNRRAESTAVRSINTSDAYVMIFVCVKNDYYSMEKAKELARMQKFKCCVKHLASIHDSALYWLGIMDPNTDIDTENQKIVDAYHTVKEIKESRFIQKLVFEGSRKHMIPFCNTLKRFFEKYGRVNWIPREGTSSTEDKELVDEEQLDII